MPNLETMQALRKSILWIAVASACGLWAVSPGQAQETGQIDALFAELADPERTDSARIEGEIQRLWSQSGSPAMDLLFRRAEDAMEAEDTGAAIEHLSAVLDTAPDFAEAWHLRATAFYLAGEFGLSLADIERALVLNPRHFGALAGLGAIMEDLGHPDLALRAFGAAQAINPHLADVPDAIARLERGLGASDL